MESTNSESSRFIRLCSQDSSASDWESLFELTCLVPEREFDAVPETELVVDDSKIVFDDVFSGADFVGDFFVFEPLGNELNDSLFAGIGLTCAVTFRSDHCCLRYKSVASLTRLIPLVMPNRRKSLLKCAFTVRRAIFNCLAISALSHPCNNSSTICCSRRPRRI